MTPFTRLRGIAAPLPATNVDTDQIVPKQFLKTIDRSGLKRALFYDHRFGPDGAPLDFILDRAPYDRAVILVAGDNFGCGSSREHAPWALLDFGIRCVVSTRIADIFFNNSVNNGLLPATVSAGILDALMQASARGEEIAVDLESCTIGTRAVTYPFSIDPRIRHRLLRGLDPIGETLDHAGTIDTLEARLAAQMPWLAF